MILPPSDLERVKLGRVPEATDKLRAGESGRAVSESLKTVKSLAQVAGRGTEINGTGDPRIPRRRAAVGNLLAARDQNVFEAERLQATPALQQNVPADISWLEQAERMDYQPGADGSQFSFASNSVSGGIVYPATIERQFDKYLADGLTRSAALNDGSARYFDVSDGNLAALEHLPNPEVRARALGDALLQIRGATLQQGAQSMRIDVAGAAQTAVERQLLAHAGLHLDDASGIRDYALLREIISSTSAKSGNNIFKARNAVGALFGADWSSRNHPTAWVKHEVPPGASASPYEAIHHNFSRNTPNDITAFVREWMFPLGPREERAAHFLTCVGALERAEKGDVAGARRELAGLEKQSAHDPELAMGLAPLWDYLHAAADDRVAATVQSFLTGLAAKPLGEDPSRTLSLAAEVYRTVCADRPTAAALREKLFHAGPAYLDVAGAVARMREGKPLPTLRELGNARLALQKAILDSSHGYERQERLFLDADLNRVLCEELGGAVAQAGSIETDAQRTHALVAVDAALKGIEASGLHGVRDPKDAAAGAGDRLPELREKVGAMLASGRTTQSDYRRLMGELHRFSVGTAQDIRSFFDGSAARVASANIDLDPFFLDQFLKQSPLHYLTALSEQGRRSGLREEISPRRIANVEGMRVLNGIGPTVYPQAVIAEDGEQLARLAPGRDVLAVVHDLNEKKLVMAGGLIVDTKDAPGGNSHLNVYGMNNGIPVVALPELSRGYREFFENAAREGGIYLDDTDGFEMMTLQRARELGHVTDENQNDLRPGVNRVINYLRPSARGNGVQRQATHSVHVSSQRPTREVELYLPRDEVRGQGRQSMSFDDLGALGTVGRHLAGEKGLVLAMMRADPELREYVPDGSVVTTGRVNQILAEAGLSKIWLRPFTHDPKVGRITDRNFTQSAFYTDAAFRASTRSAIRAQTDALLEQHFFTPGADGPTLTGAGHALLEELNANPTLAQSGNWIARSSFTGEDRPGKSGAGQYESYPDLKTPEARVRGIMGVLGSAWDAEPVENNVNEEINLRHIAPSVVVQDCLSPEVSGVAVSKDRATQARGRVSYQLVRGFGGGVEGGSAEEGLIGASSHRVDVTLDGAEGGLVSGRALQDLRQLVLKIERFFDAKVEPGKGHTVDVELARQGDQWKVVQARVLLAGE